jgi:hypothetical protein
MNQKYIKEWVEEMKKKRLKVAQGKRTLRELIKKEASDKIIANAVREMFS